MAIVAGLLLFLTLGLAATPSEAGTLVPKPQDQNNVSIFSAFWTKMDDFMSGALHLIGSILPIRGLATIGKDLGFPYADNILAALTPTTDRFTASFSQPHVSQRRMDTAFRQEETYTSMRDELSSAIGALLGKGQCQKRLACLSGRHLSHINGASSVALLASTASSFLPEDFHEPLSIIKDSIMYTDKCDQYVC